MMMTDEFKEKTFNFFSAYFIAWIGLIVFSNVASIWVNNIPILFSSVITILLAIALFKEQHHLLPFIRITIYSSFGVILLSALIAFIPFFKLITGDKALTIYLALIIYNSSLLVTVITGLFKTLKNNSMASIVTAINMVVIVIFLYGYDYLMEWILTP